MHVLHRRCRKPHGQIQSGGQRNYPPSESRRFQLFHEIVDAILVFSAEKFLHLDLEHFGEVEQRLIVSVRSACFDFETPLRPMSLRQFATWSRIGFRPSRTRNGDAEAVGRRVLKNAPARIAYFVFCSSVSTLTRGEEVIWQRSISLSAWRLSKTQEASSRKSAMGRR